MKICLQTKNILQILNFYKKLKTILNYKILIFYLNYYKDILFSIKSKFKQKNKKYLILLLKLIKF